MIPGTKPFTNTTPLPSASGFARARRKVRAASITLHQEDQRLAGKLSLFGKRLMQLTGNELITPLPPMINPDPVGSDIADVSVCARVFACVSAMCACVCVGVF